MSIIDIVAASLWLMLPAYIANPTAAVFGGGSPMDFGKKFYDGKRILGDGKTIRGLVAGTACGFIAGCIQITVAPHLIASEALSDWAVFHSILGAYSPSTIHVVFLMALGALLGDSVESFIKRRLNMKRGAMFPVADQLDFVLGALILTFIIVPLWFKMYFTVWIVVTVLVITPLLHITTNVIGYCIRVKKEPW